MKNCAVIGFGLAGSVFHAPLIASTPGLRVGTIVTSNPERAADAQRQYSEARVAATAQEVWDAADEYDLAVIATTNDSHVPLAKAAIDAGLNVVVDKPLAPTAALARGVIEHAERSGVMLTAFHNRRWDSDFLTLRGLIESGELDQIHRYESRFERWRPEPPEGSWRFQATREGGGGVLLDLGTHLVDQALQLFGPAEDVSGDVHHRRGTAGDDDAFIAIRHESGVVSHLWASEVAASGGPRMRVLGSNGAFVVEGLDGQEDALRGGRRPNGEWGVEPEERWGRLVRGDDSRPVQPQRGAWPEFYRRLEAALRGEGELPVDPRDAVEVLEALERTAAEPEPTTQPGARTAGRDLGP